MRIGMWMGAPLRALGVVAVMALAACGGGGDDKKDPPLGVTVTVDGTAESSGPLMAGETSTIEVPSGATLVFASEGETRWDPVATGSSYTVNSFSFTSKSMTVSSNAGGALVVVFTNKADESQKATLNVTVAPKEFGRVDVVDGEASEWTYVRINRDENSVTDHLRAHVKFLDEDGNYSIWLETLDEGPTTWVTTNYDAQDRVTGVSFGSGACTDDAPVVQLSYPLHVGKQWSGTSTRTCSGVKSYDQSYERTVEAFERISVPAGAFDALRVKSVVNFTNLSDPNVPGGAYSSTRTCWWATTLGRNVKCEFTYAYPDGVSGNYSRSLTQTMTRQPD
jgi:hypothetical protein